MARRVLRHLLVTRPRQHPTLCAALHPRLLSIRGQRSHHSWPTDHPPLPIEARLASLAPLTTRLTYPSSLAPHPPLFPRISRLSPVAPPARGARHDLEEPSLNEPPTLHRDRARAADHVGDDRPMPRLCRLQCGDHAPDWSRPRPADLRRAHCFEWLVDHIRTTASTSRAASASVCARWRAVPLRLRDEPLARLQLLETRTRRCAPRPSPRPSPTPARCYFRPPPPTASQAAPDAPSDPHPPLHVRAQSPGTRRARGWHRFLPR